MEEVWAKAYQGFSPPQIPPTSVPVIIREYGGEHLFTWRKIKMGKVQLMVNCLSHLILGRTVQSTSLQPNLIRNNSIVYGGGSAEISCSIVVEGAADRYPGVEQYAIRAFVDALDSVPMAVAENSGLQPIETLSAVKSQQIKENNYCCGTDCNDVGTNDMREQNVFETHSYWEAATALACDTSCYDDLKD